MLAVQKKVCFTVMLVVVAVWDVVDVLVCPKRLDPKDVDVPFTGLALTAGVDPPSVGATAADVVLLTEAVPPADEVPLADVLPAANVVPPADAVTLADKVPAIGVVLPTEAVGNETFAATPDHFVVPVKSFVASLEILKVPTAFVAPSAIAFVPVIFIADPVTIMFPECVDFVAKGAVVVMTRFDPATRVDPCGVTDTAETLTVGALVPSGRMDLAGPRAERLLDVDS
jgi:hypothetical protein